MSSFKFFWTAHKWVGIAAAIIFVNIAVTGFLLLIKKNVAWIQPPEQRGSVENAPSVSFDRILESLREFPELEIDTWGDVDRMDVRPGKGMLKVRANNFWEAQVDLASGDVLQTAYRRSDLIEMLHDGSFYAAWIHSWVMPATAICLLFLVFSGLYLWIEPSIRKRRRRARSPRGSAMTRA